MKSNSLRVSFRLECTSEFRLQKQNEISKISDFSVCLYAVLNVKDVIKICTSKIVKNVTCRHDIILWKRSAKKEQSKHILKEKC